MKKMKKVRHSKKPFEGLKPNKPNEGKKLPKSAPDKKRKPGKIMRTSRRGR